ncbi:MarR family transcriptional regulator [Leifsonia shinshuensis]
MVDNTSDERTALATALGHNGKMPQFVTFPRDMPDAAREYQKLITGQARVFVLRHLLLNEQATSKEMEDATGLASTTVAKAIRELIGWGFVESTSSSRDRRGQKGISYRAQVTKVRAAADSWNQWFFPRLEQNR